MRLSPAQAQLIKATIAREFESTACIWLFGSRADDSRRGGDIDLYVETQHPELMRELRCKVSLEEALDMHVDIVIRKPDQDHPIYRIAKAEGIRL